MEETLISFETAKLAKDRGFDLECKYRYYKVYAGSTLNKVGHNVGDFVLSTINKNDNSLGVASLAEAPTQSLLQKWLREVYNIRLLLSFETIDDSETAYTFEIVYDLPGGKGRKKDTWDFYERVYSFNQGGGWYNTYEEALEIGLQEALKLIKN